MERIASQFTSSGARNNCLVNMAHSLLRHIQGPPLPHALHPMGESMTYQLQHLRKKGKYSFPPLNFNSFIYLQKFFKFSKVDQIFKMKFLKYVGKRKQQRSECYLKKLSRTRLTMKPLA